MERSVMSTTIENETKVAEQTLGELGVGSYVPDLMQPEKQQAFVERLKGDEAYETTNEVIPCGCMDDRCGAPLVPNAAGGTETLLVADDLTTKDFELDGDSSLDGQFQKLLTFLNESGNPTGGHLDCAALGKLATAYPHMRRNGDLLRNKTSELFGYDISDDDHNLIMSRIESRVTFSDGDEMLQKLYDEQARVDTMEGEHSPKAIVFNRRTGTTLNRNKLRDEFGEDFKALSIDEWSFEEAARATSHLGGEEEVRQKRIAMAYFNLGVASLLCGPNTPIVVRN